MIDWETVDLSAPWAPRKFAVGDRVRATVSPECRLRPTEHNTLTCDGVHQHCQISGAVVVPKTGRITQCDHDWWKDHPYVVIWDDPIGLYQGAIYAAAELELLSE